MKIFSWNVNGIRAVLTKGFYESVKKIDGDILCIQETKAHPDQVDAKLPLFEHHFWNAAHKKGYSGTAIFSKIKPLHVSYGIEHKDHDTEGRVITLEFDHFFLVNVYTPNSGEGLKRLKYRSEWDKEFLAFLTRLEKKKPVVVCGDLNVAHTPIDLAHPKANYNKSAGYTQVEIDGLEKYFAHGFVDTYREFHKEPGKYSYWSYRFNARKNNVGWRIDYFFISHRLRSKLKKAVILPDIMGSDHCPVGIEISL